MKEAIKNHMLKGGIYYTWYRFNGVSNFLDFKHWVHVYVEEMTEKQMEDFIKRNRLG